MNPSLKRRRPGSFGEGPGRSVPAERPLLIEFSTWEEKQETEMKRLRTRHTQLLQENSFLRKEHGAKDVELVHAYRLNESLDEEKDSLQKKCDNIKQRADRWETAHDYLKMKLDGFEAQINKLVDEKHQAIATVMQERSRTIEKHNEVQSLSRELKALAASYQDLFKRHEQAIGRKKSSQEKSGYELRSKVEKEKEPRIVKCTQCYTKKWPCDAGHPCQACVAREIPGGCKRVKCQFWTKGTCSKLQCGLAHEEDGFPTVIEHRKLKQKLTPMPAEVTKILNAPDPASEATVDATALPGTISNLKGASTQVNLKKQGRNDGILAESLGSHKRAKLGTTDQTNHKTTGMNETLKQSLGDPMELEADADDYAGLCFETLTIGRAFSHRSLEEHRLRDYALGFRYVQYNTSSPQGPSGIFQRLVNIRLW